MFKRLLLRSIGQPEPGAEPSPQAMNSAGEGRIQRKFTLNARAMSDQPSLFDHEATLPDGFRYHPDHLDEEEERALVAEIARLPFKAFEFHGFLGKRRVVSFGWRYDFGKASCARRRPFRNSSSRSATGPPDSPASKRMRSSTFWSRNTSPAHRSAGTRTGHSSPT